MAGFFHARQAGDLAVGKPPLRKYPKNLTVAEALQALKRTGESELSLWEELCPLTEKPIVKDQAAAAQNNVAKETVAPHVISSEDGSKETLWRCVGKMGMVDIICFLARSESLADQAAALGTPASSIVSDTAFVIQHVDSQSKLIDALAHVLDGAQHLVVSIDRSISSRLARYNSLPKVRRGVAKQGKVLESVLSIPARIGGQQEYCWLTPEDLLQFLLSCIGLFSPLPMMTIEQLGIIRMDMLTVQADADGVTALPLIQRAAREMTAVAVVDSDTQDLKLLDEISPYTLKHSDKNTALALATLSVQQFLTFTRNNNPPPPSLLHLMTTKLSSLTNTPPLSPSSSPPSANIINNITQLDSSGEESSASSSDEDNHRSAPRSHSKPNVCRPWSSLVAVMVQILTHRVGYIWVTDECNSLLGIVTYLDIIHCILSHLYS